MIQILEEIICKVLSGHDISEEDAYSLEKVTDTDQLCDAARKVTDAFFTHDFDSCSIINVRSGRCPENCKWCAQSAHYDTGCGVHGVLPVEECVAAARINHDNGIKRFSLVASGRASSGRDFDGICTALEAIRDQVGISTCASLGLLTRDEFRRLRQAGVCRYHCNLETAPSHFPSLCSTHSIEDKIKSIGDARAEGMEICSGGIIGMGETERQRIEFALTLREISPVSFPLNILCPIKGTPLESQPSLTEDEILRTVAIFRIVNPKAQIRFAGGRSKLSRDAQLKALKIGINGAIVGDLLTTIGSRVAQDRQLVAEAGLKF